MNIEITKLEIRNVQSELARLKTGLIQLEGKINKGNARSSDARFIINGLSRIKTELDRICLKAAD